MASFIVLVALGTRGDVQPICCIAEKLRRCSVKCQVVTHAEHEIWLSRPPFDKISICCFSPAPAHVADDTTSEHIQNALHSLPQRPSFIAFNLFALETFHICQAMGCRCLALSPYIPPYPCPANFESYFVSTYGPELHSQLVKAQEGESLSWSEIVSWTWPLLSERWML